MLPLKSHVPDTVHNVSFLPEPLTILSVAIFI